jgi:hypothetical protein
MAEDRIITEMTIPRDRTALPVRERWPEVGTTLPMTRWRREITGLSTVHKMNSARPAVIEPPHQVVTPIAARSAVKLGRMRYVLGISLAMAIVLMIVAYLIA